MPEIKHQFTGGKMNKDLNERIIKNGEYRDALNIQVSTSDGSEVGTVQNLLGNIELPGQDFIAENSFCIGSVSDEKNDTMYWMVAGHEKSRGDFVKEIQQNKVTIPSYNKDLIIKTRGEQITPVLVDQYSFLTENYYKNILKDNFIMVPTEIVPNLKVGMIVNAIRSNGDISDGVSRRARISGIDELTELNISVNLLSTPTPTLTITDFPITLSSMPELLVPGSSPSAFLQPSQSIFIDQHTFDLANTWGMQVGDSISIILDNGVSGQPANATIVSITQNIGVQMLNIDPSGEVGQNMTQIVVSHPIGDYDTMDVGGGPGLLVTTDDDGVSFDVGLPLTNSYIPTTGGSFLGSSGFGGVNQISITSTIMVPVLNGKLLVPGSNQWADNLEVGMSITSNQDQYLNGGFVNSITSVDGGLELEIFDAYPNGSLVIPTNKLMPYDADYISFSLPSDLIAEFGETIIQLTNEIDLRNSFYDYLFFESEKTLNFSKENLITGINVIDDMLFWTDNASEPKKINIPRSIEGTDVLGNTPTKLVNKSLDITSTNNVTSLAESYITVIKKAPVSPLAMSMITDRVDGVNYSGIFLVSGEDDGLSSFIKPQGYYDFSSLDVGDSFLIRIESNLGGEEDFQLNTAPNKLWTSSTKVVIKEFDEDGDAPGIPITDYTIKGVITPSWKNTFKYGDNMDLIDSNGEYWNQEGYVQCQIQITAIDGFPPGTDKGQTRKYAIDVFKETEKLFEFKFPRFSYRYKYQDGEYSPIAPYTQVAFHPGSFDYHPKKGFNLAMTNRVTSVVISNYVTQDMPKDVVQIDLLYKEDSSPNVYIVDTIKPTDPNEDDFNAWDKNSYELKSDVIHAVVASNQLLRPYDNVPRQALAQEISGNRIIYANYLQGYDLSNENGIRFSPRFKVKISDLSSLKNSTSEDTDRFSIKSIKSLRDYQLGVVFIDKYGRETPVISNQTGAFKVEKEAATQINKLEVGFIGGLANIPDSFKYYKFFIKETSNEYYNMAMDRYYFAEDSNYWIAFPSSDRNKIDIDSTLILKKGPDSDDLVKDPARYKVLAIENEAPDFIKTTEHLIAFLPQTMAPDGDGEPISDLFGNGVNTAPLQGKTRFSCNIGPTNNSSAANMHDLREGNLVIEFGKQGSSKTSERYIVSNVSKTDLAFNFELERPFGDDVNFIANSPTSPSSIDDGAFINVYKSVVENRPQFDGRFFAKVYADDVFEKNIKKSEVEGEIKYLVTASRKIYHMSSDLVDIHAGDEYGGSVYNGNFDWQIHSSTGGEAGDAREKSYTRGLNLHDRTLFDSSAQSDKYASIKSFFGNWVQYHGDGDNNNMDQRGGFQHSAIYEHDPAYDYGYKFAGAQDGNGDNIGFMESMDHDFRTNAKKREEAQQRDFVVFGDSGSHVGSHVPSWKWDSNSQSGNSQALTNYSTESIMQLGFGPIQPHDQSHSGEGKLSFMKYREWMDFWNLETYPGNSMDFIKPFVQKLTPGKQFRWREDPTGTVYTVVKQVQQYNRLNLSPSFSHLDGDDNYTDDVDDNIGWKQMSAVETYTLPYNYKMQKKLHFRPAMSGWNPFDSVGVISSSNGGAKISRYYNNTSETFHNLQTASTHDDIESDIIKIGTAYKSTVNDNDNDARMSVEVGMVLFAAGKINGETSNNVVELGNYLMVKNITSDDGATTLELTGYNSVNHEIRIAPNANLVFMQPTMNGLSVASAANISHFSGGSIGAVGYTMDFVEPILTEDLLPNNPAVWETEPKPSTDLDIYYEISGANPISLDVDTVKTIIPVGAKVYFDNNDGGGTTSLKVQGNSGYGNTVVLSEDLYIKSTASMEYSHINASSDGTGSVMNVVREGGGVSKFTILEILSTTDNHRKSREFRISTNLYNTYIPLNWHNCYSFGNGVESNRIRDNFNQPFLGLGVKASSVIDEEVKQEHRKYGLIYSGIYNSTAGINNLNQFIQAEAITKDINPNYGSIQKIYSRSTADGDLIVLCEDRTLKILANKDALFNADGKPQLTATNNVLGQTIPYSGEFGISTNPESFAADAYRIYFADRIRGAVLRLSKDGLTPISNYGMKDYFRDSLKSSNLIVGSYDDKKDEYNITLADKKVIGEELIVNGKFNGGSSGWSLGSGWTYAYGKIEGSSVELYNKINQSIADNKLIAGRTYELRFTVSNYSAGIISVACRNENGAGFRIPSFAPTNKAYKFTQTAVAGSTTNPQFYSRFYIQRTGADGAAFTGDIDNISVKELISEPITISYGEDVKGWSSFKSFIPENAESMANDYYSMVDGKIYKHHSEDSDYNNFYGVGYNSSLNVIMNESPATIKTFHTINYEGSKSKVVGVKSVLVISGNALTPQDPVNPSGRDEGYYFYFDNKEMKDLLGYDWQSGVVETVRQYRNEVLVFTGKIRIFFNATYGFHGRYESGSGKDNWQAGDVITTEDQEKSVDSRDVKRRDGWYATSINTDKQEGSISEFVEKEGKWFNNIKGVKAQTPDDLDVASINVQGIGVIRSIANNVIKFSNNINTSLQIGDAVYSQENNVITKVGDVYDISGLSVTVGGIGVVPNAGAFALFSKDSSVNESSLIGYYADIKFENNSTGKVELFSISSEITESSK